MIPNNYDIFSIVEYIIVVSKYDITFLVIIYIVVGKFWLVNYFGILPISTSSWSPITSNNKWFLNNNWYLFLNPFFPVPGNASIIEVHHVIGKRNGGDTVISASGIQFFEIGIFVDEINFFWGCLISKMSD